MHVFYKKTFNQRSIYLILLMDIGLELKFVKKKNLKSPQWLRNIKTRKKPFWKIFSDNAPQLINDGGWHFSFLKDSISIKNKISVYAHQEFNTPKFCNTENIQKKIENKEDLFDRNIKYEAVELDETFPDYIFKNKIKFKDWIV